MPEAVERVARKQNVDETAGKTRVSIANDVRSAYRYAKQLSCIQAEN